MENTQTKPPVNMTKLAIGGALLIIGMTMIIGWWSAIIVFFQGALALGCALAGLAVMYLAKE